MTGQSEEQIKKEIDDKIQALKNSKFKQQMLPAWRPVPSFGSTMITFGLFGVVFLGLGIMLYVLSDKIQEVSVPYDVVCGVPKTDPTGTIKESPETTASVDPVSNKCNITLEITAEMTGPVFVYYQLDNFYQNHRRYVKSRDYKQLMGETRTEKEIQTPCDPIYLNSQLATAGIKYNANTDPLIPKEQKLLIGSDVAIPCGLIAKSLFNDTYNLTDEATNKKVPVNETGIAWESDIKYKFKNQQSVPAEKPMNGKWQNIQWTDIENEHFIVWMRTAGLPNFRKLYGKIESLAVGKYTLTIYNNYNVKDF